MTVAICFQWYDLDVPHYAEKSPKTAIKTYLTATLYNRST